MNHQQTESTDSHSSSVKMVLQIDRDQFHVSHMVKDMIILRTDAVVNGPLSGVVTLTVDGVSEEIQVSLPDGIKPGRVRITEI